VALDRDRPHPRVADVGRDPLDAERPPARAADLLDGQEAAPHERRA
jgi:hypothetical protein